MSTERDPLKAALTNSVVGGTLLGLAASVRAGVASSTTAQWVETVEAASNAAVRSSMVARAGRTLAEWVRASRGYRWLTAEPEATSVVVIDLRETRTVGPFVAALERTLSAGEGATSNSTLYRATASVAREFRRAPIRLVSAVICVAVLTNAAALLVAGEAETGELAVRAAVLVSGVVGTQIRTPLRHLRDAKTVRLVVGLLEPPTTANEDEPRRRDS